MDYILNELSLPKGSNDTQFAKNVMKIFVFACRGFKQVGFSSLRLQEDIFSCELCENYMVYNWVADTTVEKELRQRFKSILLNSPCIPESDSINSEVLAYSEFLFKDSKAIGLGAAYLLETVSLSFHTSLDWETLTIKLNQEELHKDGSLKTMDIYVNHSFNEETALSYKDWLGTERIKRLKKSRGDLGK